MKDAEKGLGRTRESQDWLLQGYGAAFEQSRDAIMFQDQEGFRHCNPVTLTMFRVPDVATFATLHPVDLSPPFQPDGQPSREAATAHIDQALKVGQAFFEWRSRTWDGLEFSSEVLLSRIDLEEGPILQAVVRDISERKELEQTRRRQKVELEEAQRIGGVGSWVWDISAGTLSWSDEIYRIFGVAPQSWEATYEAFLDFVHPDDREMVDGQVQQALAGEIRYDLEHRIQTPEGAERTVHERAEVERNAAGEPIRMAGTVQDVTERKALEGELRESEANYRSLVEQHRELLVHRYLPDTTELFVNSAFAAFFGAEPDDFMGWRWVDFVPPEDRQAVWDHLATYTPEAPFGQYENPAIDAQGRQRWTRWSNQAFFDDDGRIQYLQAVGLDVTEHRETEDALRQRAKQEATVLALSTELLAAQYEEIDATIQKALAQIGQMAGVSRSRLFQVADDGLTMTNTHEWCAEGVSSHIQTLQGLPTADIPWLMDQFRSHKVVPIRSLAEIPDPGFREWLARQGIRSLMMIPMVWGEDLIGVVDLHDRDGERGWSESEQDLLRVAADNLTGALGRQRLESELRYQARHDPLTGLVNRRPFEEALVRETIRAQRYGQTFSLIMLDIDHFKAVNDTFGHEVGDRILEELSALLSNRLRGEDLLARWGGEEFIALLPETGEGGARELAEDIRHQLAEQDFPWVGHLTVSLGVAEYRAYEELEDITKRVDEAMYVAKEGGRNRVVVDGEGRET